MKTNKTVSVIGGDTRNIYTAKYLAQHGYRTYLCGFENHSACSLPPHADLETAMSADAVVLPLPYTKNGRTLNAPFAKNEIPLADISALVTARQTVFYGMCTGSFPGELGAKGVKVYDYYKNEGLTVKNALLTAEGILGTVIEKLPVTVWRLNVAVTGYGRVAYFICRTLNSLGANITVYARDGAQLAKAETAGCTAEHISKIGEQSEKFDVIINTVPARVIDEKTVKNSKNSCIFIETASAPYGIDFDACKKYGRDLVKAFSQPGKTAPETAGMIIADTVDLILKEV